VIVEGSRTIPVCKEDFQGGFKFARRIFKEDSSLRQALNSSGSTFFFFVVQFVVCFLV